MRADADVVIVGAGPAGLLLAGDLAAGGVDTIVLERRDTESNVTRAFALHARSLELLDARGLADELITTGRQARSIFLFDRFDIDLSQLPSRFPYVLITPQYHTERVLQRRAVAAGARILRGSKVTAVRQDADGVEVHTESGAYRCRYAVGTDGVHSTVRAELGLDFPGKAIVQSLMLADVRLTDAPEDILAVKAAADCFAFVAPFGDGWYRIFAWNRRNPLPDSAPVALEEVRAVTRRALGTDYGMHDPRWMSRFHCDERQVRRYQVGRVFLAGDAAHVHTPAGGQGMNTGLQDAANLSWKLVAAVTGHGPDDLLRTYHTERHAVGRMVVRSSGALVRLTMVKSLPARIARNAMGTAAVRIGPLTRRISGTLSGISIGYPAPPGAHPLVGRRAGDTALTDHDGKPARLYEALRGGSFVLTTPPNSNSTLPAEWAHHIPQLTSTDAAQPAQLIRPDGYIAWAGQEPGTATLSNALQRWYSPAT
jgi:2-polyprenyl-6-methoxyphenol hydroxylase-like FAD-dependent oxidoreductase